jgi:hypothetical protein
LRILDLKGEIFKIAEAMEIEEVMLGAGQVSITDCQIIRRILWIP